MLLSPKVSLQVALQVLRLEEAPVAQVAGMVARRRSLTVAAPPVLVEADPGLEALQADRTLVRHLALRCVDVVGVAHALLISLKGLATKSRRKRIGWMVDLVPIVKLGISQTTLHLHCLFYFKETVLNLDELNNKIM